MRSEAYDPSTRTYRLVYVAGRGATELSVPSALRGWRVRVAGPGSVRGLDVRAVAGATVTVTVTPRA